MIPLILRLWRAFWRDEMFAARWARGVLLWAGAVATQLSLSGEAVTSWTIRRWAIALVIAAAIGGAGLITAGQPNPRPPAQGFTHVAGVVALTAIGLGIYLYALAHAGLP